MIGLIVIINCIFFLRVASGVPEPFKKHAQEICIFALEIRESLGHCQIPHLPNEILLIRIGIHSGIQH